MKQILDLARGRSLPASSEDIRTGLSPAALARAVADNLYYVQARVPEIATRNDWYMALAYTVRDRLLDRWIKTVQGILTTKDVKVVYYLSRSLAFTMRSLRGRFLLYGILNAYWEALNFQLPPVTEGPDRLWRRCIDTALDSPQDICEPAECPAVREATYRVQPRSIVILLARIGA